VAPVFNAATFFVDRHLVEGRGERVAHRAGARRLTWHEIAEQANRWGNALGELGVARGDRVLIALGDSAAFVPAFWGTVKAGAVAVPINPLLAAADYEFLLADSGAKALVADEAVAAKLANPGSCAVVRSQEIDGLLGRASATFAAAPTHADDVTHWGYTSGSTGRPKAAVHTHAHLRACAELVGLGVFAIGPDDVVFSASKMYFTFGLGNTLLFPAAAGAVSLLVAERMEAERAFEIITRERPTAFFAVPTLYTRMLQVVDAARRFDLSSLRLCVSSGEALPPAVFDAWQERFGLPLHDVIGSTEALHDFIATRPGRVRRGTLGEVVPGFEARIVDDDGHDVPAGAAGHLIIKGPTTAPHYWNRPDRTEATMVGEWLRTGDMMSRDADGFFRFFGRSDDMLKVAGQWVSPAEVEARLVEHPLVLEAAVFPRANAAGMAEAHACVVLQGGGAGTPSLERELRDWTRAALPGHKVPRALEFVAELPKTATGKIQRFRLRLQGSG